MKFKAQIHDKDKFLKIITSMDKIGKEFFIVFSPTHLILYLKVTPSNNMKVRMEIDMRQIFSDIIIQSLSEDHIYFCPQSNRVKKRIC
jgi:hypothetical protein